MQQDQTEVDVCLNYRSSVYVGDTEHSCGGGYILQMEAVVMGRAEGINGENPVDLTLGILKFYIIRVGNASNARVHLHDVFDTFQETVDVGNAIYNSSYSDFIPAVERLFPDANPWCDILILHYLTILPYARGQRLGLSVLERVMRDWSSGRSLVVMKPFPLQFESKAKQDEDWESLALGKFPRTQREAFQRLRAYYKLLGFERLAHRSTRAARRTYIPPPRRSGYHLSLFCLRAKSRSNYKPAADTWILISGTRSRKAGSRQKQPNSRTSYGALLDWRTGYDSERRKASNSCARRSLATACRGGHVMVYRRDRIWLRLHNEQLMTKKIVSVYRCALSL